MTRGVKFYPPGEPAIEGLAAVEQWCQKADAEFTLENIEASSEKYTHAGDYIIEIGQFSCNLKPKAGGDAVAEKGTFLAVWKRQAEGGWKIACDIWNSDNPFP